MANFYVATIIALYLIPSITLIGIYPFEATQVIVVSLFWLLGYLSVFSLRKFKSGAIKNGSHNLPSSYFFLVFIIYTIAKIDTISVAAQSLTTGNIVNFMYQNAVARYENFSEVSTLGLIDRAGTVSFLMSGFIFANLKQLSKLSIFCFLLMILIDSLSLARFGALFVFVSYVFEKVRINTDTITNARFSELFKYSFILTIFLIAIFGFSAYFRIAGRVDNIFDVLLMKFTTYTIAMYEALLIWMSQQEYYISTFGKGTLAGPLKMFGLTVEQGFYGLQITRFGNTNIYTNMRGLLSDFGLVGTCLVMYAGGLITSAYSVANRGPVMEFLVRFYGVFIMFVIFSPYIFFNTFVAVLCVSILFLSKNFWFRFIW